MDKSIMENESAGTQTMHIAASGMSTTMLSGNGPTSDSTGLDSARSGYTATASRSHIRCILEEMTEEHANRLIADFSDLWKARIVEELEPGIYQITMKTSSSDGSTGPSPEEAGRCD